MIKKIAVIIITTIMSGFLTAIWGLFAQVADLKARDKVHDVILEHYKENLGEIKTDVKEIKRYLIQ